MSAPIKVLTIVGARPNFMKAAPIVRAIRAHNEENKGPKVDHLLVHTGQHYDEVMSDRFFSDLGLPKPDVHLGVGSASHAVQTAEIMKKFESVMLEKKPHVVVVVGDVNSTVACALVTAKVPADSSNFRPLIAHVEAGLRSFDRAMPEEINRIVTDHLSDLLFVTEESGIENLRKEGISEEKIHFVGNTMIDSLLAFSGEAESSKVLDELHLRNQRQNGNANHSIARYVLVTLHRPSNVDDRMVFRNILEGLGDAAGNCPVIFPVHPRTRQRIREFGLESHFAFNADDLWSAEGTLKNGHGKILLTDPRGYVDFLCLMKHAALVVTDSGGIQEETTCLGVPCVTVRENTERPVTLKLGTNVLAGTDSQKIKQAVRSQMNRQHDHRNPKNWDGQAAIRIVEVLSHALKSQELIAP